MKTINTEEFSNKLREKAIKISDKRILITNYHGTEQEKDLHEAANCNGFGRVRHFKLNTGNDWPLNPLPIVPAQKYLGLSGLSEFNAQVFQNSICNWRCWYCYVDFKLLNGDSRYSSYLTCGDLLDMYQAEELKAPMIDLSGGQPDLTPEWIPWMMEELKSRNLDDKIFLWSDDNLSNDFFWKFLSQNDIDVISSYKMYARVCCFKGIDEQSFHINTKADPKLFYNQIELFKRLWELDIDLYAYITLTAPKETDFESTIPRFLDLVQKISDDVPLKIIPLRIFDFFTPVQSRNDVDKQSLLTGQMKAIEVWQKEINNRFSSTKRSLPIYTFRKTKQII